MKRFWLMAALCALMLIAPLAAQALSFELPLEGGGSAVVHTIEIDGAEWLFLPAFADPEALGLSLSESDEEGVWEADGLYVVQSDNLRTVFLMSADPVNEGRAFIDGSERHTTRTTGSILLVSEDGHVDHADQLRQLRGRGNTTWTQEKKAYQFKLETKADLLGGDDPAEKNRTWVLMADAMDATLLHNRVSLDFGRELGMENTSRNEHVHLYYDGEYRGLYLLCEKVEISEGRIDEVDYDKLLEKWNNAIGQTDLTQLPVGEGTTERGSTYTYIEGVADSGLVDAGAYFMEIENPLSTLSDRCYIHLPNDQHIAAKNPENPSEAMMRYITLRLEDAWEVVKAGGVDPATGRTLDEVLDVDGFARLLLLSQVAYNRDVYGNSSSWYILPAGESRFIPGTVWDYDLAWMPLRRNVIDHGMGVFGGPWTNAMYACEEVMEAMQRIYRDELRPLLHNVLLGEEHGTYLKPLSAYAGEIRSAWHMNRRRWPQQESFGASYVMGDTFEESMAIFASFAAERDSWLYPRLMAARDDAELIQMWGCATYHKMETMLDVYVCPWNHVTIDASVWHQLTEATEDGYAVWQLDILLAPMDGYTFHDPIIDFDGVEIKGQLLEDGRLYVSVWFEDKSYHPVDYYGEDIGMIYDYETYLKNHPEVVDVCGDDPQDVMDYFCDEGMYEDHMGNGYFRPSDILQTNPQLADMLGEDWSTYYWDFLGYGFEDGWLERYAKTFPLEVWMPEE